MSLPECSEAQARWRHELAQLAASGLQVRYPWSLFFGGAVTYLRQGVDFHGSTLRMQGSITNAAWRRGLRVRTGATPEGDVKLCVLGPAKSSPAAETSGPEVA